MKKLTAFFMALMPVFVITLLFICGMIVKSSTHVNVTAVEVVNNEISQNVRDLSSADPIQLEVNVLPKNASNPEVFYKSSDTSIAEVNAQGLITPKDYGECYIYAFSKENETLNSKAKLEIGDTIYHDISIDNKESISYVGLAQTNKLQITTKPKSTTVKNPNLNITSSDETVVKVTTDGLLIPQSESGTSTITVETQASAEQPSIKQTVDVKIGPGIEQLDLDNPQKEDLASPIGYNLFDNLKTSPETIDNLSASDFTFSSDNKNIAEIDKTGAVKFTQPGEATFSAVYSRDTTKKVSKTINCTYDHFIDAAFSSTTYSATIDSLPSTKIIDHTALDYYVYPEQTYASSSVILDSSNTDVIRPVWNSTTCKYDFQVNQPGTALLTVSVLTGIKDMPVQMDSCLVTIGLDKDSIVKEDSITLNDSYYYALRNNINTSIKHPSTPAVSFELDSENIAYIDDNEILHFKEAGEVTVTATVAFESGTATKDFVIKCNEHINEINVDQEIKTYQAGQRCKIVSSENYQPTFNGCSDKFDVTTDAQGNKIFIAKHGCSFEHFELKNSSGKTKEIAITFTEDPLYVKSDKSAYETVDNTKSYPLNFKEWANPTIFPSTATKKDGTNYELNYSYDVQTEEVASVEGDNITFLAPGIVQATVSWDEDHYYSFNIKSTYGKLGRIKMFETDGYYWNEFHNGKAFTLAPNGTLELRTNVMYYSEYEQLKATSLNNMCSVKIDSDASELVQRHSYITITAHDNVYGSDVIKLETGTYTFYININVSPAIQSIKVFNFGKEITKDTKTYTTNLKDLQIVVGPTSAHGQTYNVTFNGNAVTPTKGSVYDKLDLSGQTWSSDKSNTLVFTNSEGTTIGEYSMLYSTSTPTITVEGSIEYQTENNDTKKGIFLPANANQRSLLLSTDGFVESSFWSKITSELASTEKGETTSISGNLLSISQIPEPDFSIYENTLILKNDGSKIAEYTIGRDFVTKILLPKHDNNDETDKKGFQKVHVYGNCSYYNPTEGVIDYYKLPIQLFNYKHEKIGDDGTEEGKTLKALAYSTLLTSINNNCEAQYDSENGFIKIYFKNNVFTDEEIANDAFDTKDLGKKVKFDIHTKSTTIDANYTFVPVSGVNCYCQEGLIAVRNNEQAAKGGLQAVVLQTNFGLEEGTPDNQPLTDEGVYMYKLIYGNGYALRYNEIIKKRPGYNIGATAVINTKIMGTDPELTAQLGNTAVALEEPLGWQKIYGYYYSTYEGFNAGYYPDPIKDTNKKVVVKNCLFYRNLQADLNCGGGAGPSQQPVPTTYIENCAFLNSGGFPILATFNAPIYLKGNMSIYNFHNKEMLAHLMGQDLRILWPALLKAAQLSHMTQVGADGKEYVNSFMFTGLNVNIYFYNQETGQYEKGTAGREGAVKHMSKYFDVHLPMTSIEASMWASVNPNHEQGAPNYWDAYDADGNMKPTFFNSQVKKLFRQINYF